MARHCLSLGFALLAPASAMCQCHSGLAIEAIANVVLHVLVESVPLACLTHGYSQGACTLGMRTDGDAPWGPDADPSGKRRGGGWRSRHAEAVGPFADR